MALPRPLATPTYLVAFALMIIPPFDSLMTVVPFRLGEARWRFGAFGLASNALMLSLTGLLVALIATVVFDHPRFRRVLGVVCSLLVLFIAAAWIVFVLDILQVRNDIKPAAAFAFKVASATAAAKAMVAITTLIALTVAAFRGPKAAASAKARGPGDLIMAGRPSTRMATPAEPSA